ncbi:methyltransferase [Streptomyces spectabilis]|uniref:SAM-dependent methyltransferase n=2 Tax=Streptomyces spectabilis TaxID=68270 RepID=A0A7W8AYK7_STRST|nr:SAM-dependent methyltransferase [Streptomyces spectabilis]GGV04840.1 methyltransferase [Streptomyces spectabilis]
MTTAGAGGVMLDYGKEAVRYDASRGGEPRAAAAAAAVLSLLLPGTRTLLDVACGTGLVTRRFADRPGLAVTGVDATYAMARMAAERVPGAVVLGDSRRLPFPDGAFDAVASVWLLHLFAEPAEAGAVVAECARVLRPGGRFVTTVDKAASHNVGSDIDAALAGRPVRAPVDGAARVEGYAAACGLTPAGRARFTGHGQGRSPRSTAEDLFRGWFTSIPTDSAMARGYAARLAELPDQDVRRPDPEFALRAFTKPVA